ncbi:MAG TPA: helix-turn-helix domain-containing protein [Pyrinomonadaceae bacterium]
MPCSNLAPTNAYNAAAIPPEAPPCQRISTPEPKPLGYPEETRREAVRLYLEGTNFRRIGRVLGVNHQSVVNWVNAYHAGLPTAAQSPAAPETLEMDELFTFIGSKKRRRTS